MNLAALTFARTASCELNLDRWPELGRGLVLGPLVPSCFRLEGPDALPGAAEMFARDVAAFGAITSNEMAPRERMYRERVRRSQYAQLIGRERTGKSIDLSDPPIGVSE